MATGPNIQPGVRTSREIIDEAISDNRRSEYLAYRFATVFVLVGVAVIVWSMFAKEPLATIGGSIESVLFWPALNSVRRTRKENIAIRLLEAPLSRADSAKEAADMLRDAFKDVFVDNRSESRPK